MPLAGRWDDSINIDKYGSLSGIVQGCFDSLFGRVSLPLSGIIPLAALARWDMCRDCLLFLAVVLQSPSPLVVRCVGLSSSPVRLGLENFIEGGFYNYFHMCWLFVVEARWHSVSGVSPEVVHLPGVIRGLN